MEADVKKILLLAVAAAALTPAAAQASDRDHDGMGDRWEQRHHVRSAVKDTDHDGLRNRGEFRHKSDPRDADTDDDGLRDGAEVETGNDPCDRDSDDDGRRDDNENAGTVKSFDGTTLVIALADGSEVSGTVTDATEVECDDEAEHGDDRAVLRHEDGEDDDDAGEGEDGDHCGSDALVAGAIVHEAELKATASGAWFEKVELEG
jgi:hypothetical protein